MKLYFPVKGLIISYHPLTFNNIPVAQTNFEKHLGLQLNKKLNFEEHLSKVESNANNKIIDIITNFKMFFHDQHFLQFISH